MFASDAACGLLCSVHTRASVACLMVHSYQGDKCHYHGDQVSLPWGPSAITMGTKSHYYGDQVPLPWGPSPITMGTKSHYHGDQVPLVTSVCLGEKYQSMCPKCACEVNAVNCCMCACGGCARHMCARHAGPSIIAFSVLYHHGRSMRTAIYMYGTV